MEALPAVILPILGILAPVFALFWKKDRDEAFERLLSALPDIWAVVQQERRKSTNKLAVEVPLERGVQLAEKARGRIFNEAELARVQIALRAIHERKGAPDPRAIKFAPTGGKL